MDSVTCSERHGTRRSRPHARSAVRPNPKPTEVWIGSPSHVKESVLLVDDDEDTRGLMCEALRLRGFEV